MAAEADRQGFGDTEGELALRQPVWQQVECSLEFCSCMLVIDVERELGALLHRDIVRIQTVQGRGQYNAMGDSCGDRVAA